jgi:hypothetical protein
MGVAHGLVLDGAQPEALVGVVCCLLEPPIVENEHLGLGVFEIKLTVVRALQTAGELSARAVVVEAGAIEKGGGR